MHLRSDSKNCFDICLWVLSKAMKYQSIRVIL